MTEGGAYSKRGINLPIIGQCYKCTKTNKNFGTYQGGIIIGAVNSYIYCGEFNTGLDFVSRRNNIISSIYSCIGCTTGIDSIKYSSIISSKRSSITGFDCFSSHGTIIGSNYGKIERSIQSTVIGGYKNYISDYYVGYSYPSRQNFIGSGQYNEIYNGKILQGCVISKSYSGLNALNSILSGQKNKINGSYNSSILAGISNKIETCTQKGKTTNNNFIGTGKKNYISSYSEDSKKHYCGSGQSIISGYKNSVRNSSYSSILNGVSNYIGIYYQISITGCGNNGVTILNGQGNQIFQSPNSSILNGCNNFIGYKKVLPGDPTSNNVIVNGVKNQMYFNCNSSIINGLCNKISNTCESSILSGDFNIIQNSKSSTIIHGSGSFIINSCNSTIDSTEACILYSSNSTVISDSVSFIRGLSKCGTSQNNAVIGGYKNRLCTKAASSQQKNCGFFIKESAIIGGYNNLVEATVEMCSTGIVGGYLNIIRRSKTSAIFGGGYNKLGATSSKYDSASIFNSSIVGGSKNCISIGTKDVTVKDYRSCNNVIIGGYCNSFTCECVGLSSVIVGGYKLQGLVTDCNGSVKITQDLVQSENFSLRGNMYVNNSSKNRCKGISSINVNSNQIITSICVVQGIIITMSYS